ncbi:MAG: zinc-binding dehydrogenase [Candidatus Sumerlaeota bacterium]|nr:zinc-binding dehydrogenase [Candidatus Sumerlaeota bacterium]
MPLHKGRMKRGFSLPRCEKHFHDHDETWLILAGKGSGYWIDPQGQREEFVLEEGDVWMVPAGYEHGSDGFPGTGKNSDDFTIAVSNGTLPEGCHKPGHHYVDREGYIPSLQLVKTPTDRYTKERALPETMKGIMFVEQGKAVLQDEPTPVCQPGTVLCQSLFTGLTNGTERNFLCGGNYGGRRWPRRSGYQNVGKILEIGAGCVRGYNVGDIVYTGNFCYHRQYFAAPAKEDSLLAKLPPAVDPKHAALFGVASVAMHDVRRADVRIGDRVLVIGAGPVGQFTAQAARLAGAVVTVCDLNARRLEAAAGLGAHKTMTPDEDWANIKGGGPYDCVFEDSGAPILDRVLGPKPGQGILKRRGRLVMIAGRDEVNYTFNCGQACELTIHHAGHFDLDDLLQVCRLTSEGAIQVGPIIQEVVPFANMPSVYDRLRDDPASLFGVVFQWA